MVLKIRFPEIGSSAKSHRLVRGANATYSANFIRISGFFFLISCTVTHTYTGMNALPLPDYVRRVSQEIVFHRVLNTLAP